MKTKTAPKAKAAKAKKSEAPAPVATGTAETTTAQTNDGPPEVVETQPASASAAPAPAARIRTPKTTGEHLVGKTLDGDIDVVVRRRTLTTESKIAKIKRLLMTKGQTKQSIFDAVKDMHTGDAASLMSTINTTRSDLSRATGKPVLATGWRTDGQVGKLPTAAVARLRTHEDFGGALSDGEVQIVNTPAANAEGNPPAETPEGEKPAEGEQTTAGAEDHQEEKAEEKAEESGDDDDSGDEE